MKQKQDIEKTNKDNTRDKTQNQKSKTSKTAKDKKDKEYLNKVRHRSIELFSEKMILKNALKKINIQKNEIQQKNVDLQQKNEEILTQQEYLLQANDEIKEKNEKLNKALAKARRRTIELFGKHIDLKKAKWFISIINEDVEKKNQRLEKAIKKSKKRTVDLFGKHIDLKKAKRRIEYQSELLQTSYNELEVKNIQINDSLDYAKHIQHSILPPEEKIKHCFPESFVFFKPKEVVSGDFYWLAEKNNNVFFAVVDCTGHGVPGAFMSMIGNTVLNQMVNEKEDASPVEILKFLNKEVIATFYKKKKDYDFQNDGMDITIMKFNKKAKTLNLCSAGHNYYVVQNDEIKMHKGCIFGIGEVDNDYEHFVFKEEVFNINKSLQLYMFSDGYTDQFGGDKNKKFHQKRLLYLIENNYKLPMENQKRIFEMAFEQWKGKEQQIDDVLLTGFRF